jgi:hypothetical protein
MRRLTWRAVGISGAAVLVCVGLACSKKKSGEEAATTNPPQDSSAVIPLGNVPLTVENAPFAPTIKEKGFQVVQAKRFPAQVDGRRAAVVVYGAPDNTRGGILYVRGFENDPPHPVWHWYFANGAPDSVAAMDINRDGLWDVRVFMSGGSNRDFIQDTDFTFTGPERAGLAAMNGASSADENLWKAFDADTSTSWRSPAAGAFIEIPNPLGLSSGQLSVRLAGGARAEKLEVADGERKIQECDLKATSEEQRFQLDPSVKTAETIRITIVGQGKNVALSELEIQ